MYYTSSKKFKLKYVYFQIETLYLLELSKAVKQKVFVYSQWKCF